jgi:hypothetical protein
MFKKIVLLGLVIAFVAVDALAGTVTITQKQRSTMGNKRVVTGKVAFTGAYSSTAFAFSPRTIGLNQIERIIFYPTDYLSARYNACANSTTAPTYVLFATNYTNPYKPAVTPAAAADSLRVKMKAFTAGDADTSVVYVTTLGGSTNAFLGIIGASIAPATSVTTDPLVFMGDSISSIPIWGDSAMTYPTVRLRGVLQGADTVFFDYNGTNRTTRLYYSGTILGNMGDLYIPVNNPSKPGRFIKIAKSTGAALYALGVHPLHFVHASVTMDEKLQIDVVGTLNSFAGVLVDTTYTSMPAFTPTALTLQTGHSIDALVYGFIAIGK